MPLCSRGLGHSAAAAVEMSSARYRICRRHAAGKPPACRQQSTFLRWQAKDLLLQVACVLLMAHFHQTELRKGFLLRNPATPRGKPRVSAPKRCFAAGKCRVLPPACRRHAASKPDGELRTIAALWSALWPVLLVRLLFSFCADSRRGLLFFLCQPHLAPGKHLYTGAACVRELSRGGSRAIQCVWKRVFAFITAFRLL